eukprot:UN11701
MDIGTKESKQNNIEDIGRVVFEIKEDKVPITAANFVALCTHSEEYGYKNSPFHRVVPDFLAQGGDFEKGNR